MDTATLAKPSRNGPPAAGERPAARTRRPWIGFLLRRIGSSLIVIWLAYTISFLLLYVMPGDAALARLSTEDGGGQVSPEQLQQLREQLGLADPLPVQYLKRLGALLIGDLGLSLRNDQQVSQIIGAAILPTLSLAGLALLIALLAGSVLAVASNLAKSRWLRSITLSIPAFGLGLPAFWVGILLISLFSFALRILPAGGNAGFAALILPAVTLAIVPSASIAQVFGTSLHQALTQPYANTTSPAKGAGRVYVLIRHCVRNAAIPALTVAGVITGHLLAGSVVIETVFSRAGIGRVMIDAVRAIDLTVVQGVVLLGATVFVVVNLLVDLSYPLLDPRLRRAGR